jgi:hypothetical protein
MEACESFDHTPSADGGALIVGDNSFHWYARLLPRITAAVAVTGTHTCFPA